jgi:hypothetical protein
VGARNKFDSDQGELPSRLDELVAVHLQELQPVAYELPERLD